MTIEEMSKNNGTTNYNGKTYVLIEQACIDPWNTPYFGTVAICPEDGACMYGLYPVYRIAWYPRKAWLDSDRSDYGWACDWSNANDVEPTVYGYDLNDGRII